MSGILLFILVILSIFRIKIGFLDLTIVNAIIAVILLAYQPARFTRATAVAFVSVSILAIWASLVSILSNSANLFFVMKFSRCALSIFSSWVIVPFVVERIGPRRSMLQLQMALLLHPVVMYVQLINPQLREWMVRNLEFTDDYHFFRVPGLLNGYVPGGMFLGFISIVLAVNIVKYRSRVAALALPLMVPLLPFSGLSGAGPFAVSLIYILWNYVRNDMIRAVKLLLATCAVAAGLVVAIGAVDREADASGLAEGVDRVMALMGDQDTGTKADPWASMRYLIESMDVPSGIGPFFVGSSLPSKALFASTETDSGIFSTWHSLGLVGLCLIVFFQLYLGLSDKLNDAILLFLIAWWIAFFKIDIAFSRIFFDLFLFLYFSRSLNKTQSSENPNGVLALR